MVTIKLNLTLIKSAGKKEFLLELKSPSSLKYILAKIRITHDEIGMVLKNGKWAPLDCTVEENDVIQLFPHLEGG